MPKDILLFGSIHQYNVMYFFSQIAEALKDDAGTELELRVNSEGGNPDYGMSVIEKVQELTDQMYVKVGAMAHSMALFILFYIDSAKAECIDTTKAVFHRAAYPSWFENDSTFKGSVFEELLAKTNKDLERAVRAKIDVDAFEALPQMKSKNLTLKDIFSLESRHEVLLTAADLKKLKLVSKINKISPTKSAELENQMVAFSKCSSLEDYQMAAQSINKPENSNPTVMTLAELKAQHPAIYAEALAEIKAALIKEGVDKEKVRVKAWLAYQKIDAEAVAKGIADGTDVDVAVMAEMQVKSFAKKHVAEVKLDASGKAIETEESQEDPEKTDKEKKLAQTEANIKAKLGIGKKVAA